MRRMRASVCASRRAVLARREIEASRRWAVAATLRFESEDERYRWLENALGVWEGEFDAEAHRARYRAYLVRNGLNGDHR